MFTIHRPTLTLQLHNFDLICSGLVVLHCCVAIGKISTDTTHRAVPRRYLSFLFVLRLTDFMSLKILRPNAVFNALVKCNRCKVVGSYDKLILKNVSSDGVNLMQFLIIKISVRYV